MGMVALERRIGSAFVVYCGHYGDVSQFAVQQSMSRQWVYREARQVADILRNGTQIQQERDLLRSENAALREEVAQLRQRLALAVVLDKEKQTEVACVGQACGVTLA